jgi:pseudouridine-5'-phosphate glycosidase
MTSFVHVSDEVRAAIAADNPVVALESTIVAHGLPWPENLEIGRALEAEVRRHGAIPATIAVVKGEITVGIDGETLERMARAGDAQRWRKAGVADVALLCARGLDGATTVSATTFAAARAGIRVFATGGVGGVHRGDGMDVSSDLTTLAREPVAVVSAGAKAILDLPRTLEMLETLAVPVLAVGTNELPAFYTRHSGLHVEHRIESAEDAARICQIHWALGQAGLLIANPIPEADALDPELVNRAIDAALADAAREGIRGKALTPHLLAHLSRMTEKQTLSANRALALNNAAFGAELAVALSKLAPLN